MRTISIEEHEYIVSRLLDAATNGKWSKPNSDVDTMCQLIRDEIADQISDAIDHAIYYHR